MIRASSGLANWHSLAKTLGDDCLRISSYNLHRCVGRDGKQDAGRIAQVINELGCNVVGLQEVDNQFDGGHASLQLEYLAQQSGMHAIAGHTMIDHQGNYGNGLLTRHPIIEVRQHDFSYRAREPRGALDVELDVAGTAVRVIVTHLGLRPAERRFQVNCMLKLLHDAPIEQPVVVLGDINEWLPLGRPLRWMNGMFGRAPTERSFPAWRPLFALDRVWVRPRHNLLAFTTHRSTAARQASDHLPVKALIATGRHLPARKWH
ncbi:MAG: endonuclease/exonuclease/phosphatase family protein [Propionivibrio sp.]